MILDIMSYGRAASTNRALAPTFATMTVKQLTTFPTEADLEGAIHAGVRRTFPWLSKGAIRHQTKFAFSFGRATIEVDGAIASRSEARADILLYWGEQPLAVLELKRNGVAITKGDEEQGLSYARMLHPRPPLVAVTNGEDVRLLETHTGQPWNPSNAEETAFKQLVGAASRASAHDVKQAVSTLMGSSPDIWAQAVREASASSIAELSGSWGNAQFSFVPEFLIPRKATTEVVSLLRQGSRLVTVEGPPLVGKSSVLREVVERTADADDLVVFFVEAEAGSGVFQGIADVLRSAPSWPVTREEARDWVLRLSKATGPALVIAVDGLGSERDDVRRDVEDITSSAFGPSVRVVAALDDAVADRVMLNSNARKASAIGRRADRVRMGLLDNDEFNQGAQVLWANRLTFMRGAQSAEELRVPWALRAVCSRYEGQFDINKELAAGLPPLLGLELIVHTRERFVDDELRRLFRQTAEAVLKDAHDRKRPVSLILQSLATFVVRRRTLLKFVELAEIENLINQGFLKPFQPRSGDAVLVVRLPELLASEIADLLGVELIGRAVDDPEKAADWIAGRAGSLPLGDVLAAQAICDAAVRHSGLPLNLIVSLLATPPKRHTLGPGTRAAVYFPGLGTFDMTFREGGAIAFELNGRHHIIEPDPGDEEHTSYSDFHHWLILSHLAGRPFVVDTGAAQARVDPTLLLEVGSCAIVLRRPGGDPDVVSVLTHEIPGHGSIVCHEAGIVEPITWSMFCYLSSEGSNAAQWIEEVVKRQSLPLLARADIALRYLAATEDQDAAPWALQTLEEVIWPALKALPELHIAC